MDALDKIYLAILILSIPFGHVVKLQEKKFYKQIYCLAAGLLIVLLLVGIEGMIHSLITIIGNYIIVRLIAPRSFHLASFLFTFAYLLFYRCCSNFGFPVPPKHSNAVQLLVTLRMINLAYELHASETRSRNTSENTTLARSNHNPSMFDFFVYGYCYIGLMTGPFFTYTTFNDMLHQNDQSVSTFWPVVRQIKQMSFLIIPYIVAKEHFPLEYLASDECLEHPNGVVHILPVMFFVYNWFRWRYLIGWKLAECMCITAGLGAYPFECEAKPGLGPTKEMPINFDPVISAKEHYGDTHDFTTVHNIDVFEIEGCDSLRSGMKAWNKTVQWWMAHHVYKNLPFKSKNIRLCLLLAVSAFWHGIHSGYYIAFAMVIPWLVAETSIEKSLDSYITTEKKKYLWSWVKWFFFFRYLDFISVPFMFLEFNTMWKIWSRVYFFGLTGAAFVVVLSFFIPKKRKLE